MGTLNYKHLHYFWVVAKTGGVARAGEQLHLTPQSISGQLRVLEEALGEKLLRRAGGFDAWCGHRAGRAWRRAATS